MSTHNIDQLKALFEEACQTTPPSVVLACLFNGHSIHKAKTNLIRATRLIEQSRVNIPLAVHKSQGERLADLYIEIIKQSDKAAPNQDALSATSSNSMEFAPFHKKLERLKKHRLDRTYR